MEKYFQETSISIDLYVSKFQAMVGYFATTHHILFFKKYLPMQRPNHNNPLHLELYIKKNKIRRVLVDSGVGMNMCTLKLVMILGFFEAYIDTSNKIIIRAYDNAKFSSKGLITLPIRV